MIKGVKLFTFVRKNYIQKLCEVHRIRALSQMQYHKVTLMSIIHQYSIKTNIYKCCNTRL